RTVPHQQAPGARSNPTSLPHLLSIPILRWWAGWSAVISGTPNKPHESPKRRDGSQARPEQSRGLREEAAAFHGRRDAVNGQGEGGRARVEPMLGAVGQEAVGGAFHPLLQPQFELVVRPGHGLLRLD